MVGNIRKIDAPDKKMILLDVLSTLEQTTTAIRRISNQRYDENGNELPVEDPQYCYCIEGAMCQAFHLATGLGYWEKNRFFLDEEIGFFAAPLRVHEWFFGEGCDQDALLNSPVGVRCAMDLNDTYHYTFPQFIQLIEEQW